VQLMLILLSGDYYYILVSIVELLAFSLVRRTQVISD